MRFLWFNRLWRLLGGRRRFDDDGVEVVEVECGKTEALVKYKTLILALSKEGYLDLVTALTNKGLIGCPMFLTVPPQKVTVGDYVWLVWRYTGDIAREINLLRDRFLTKVSDWEDIPFWSLLIRHDAKCSVETYTNKVDVDGGIPSSILPDVRAERYLAARDA